MKDEDDEDRGTGLTLLPCKKRGRLLLLGPELDKKVQLYLRRVRDAGGVVNARIAVAAAKGVIKRFDKFKLAEYGGPIELNVAWANALLEHIGYVKRKATTAKSKYEVEKFKELKRAFLNDVKITVEMEDIPAELILNWGQTGIRIVHSSNWTMEVEGARRVEIIGVSDKQQITTIFCGLLTGEFYHFKSFIGARLPDVTTDFSFLRTWTSHTHLIIGPIRGVSG